MLWVEHRVQWEEGVGGWAVCAAGLGLAEGIQQTKLACVCILSRCVFILVESVSSSLDWPWFGFMLSSMLKCVNERWSWFGGGLCTRPCCCAFLLVYTHAYMWEREVEQWVRTPNDSALHGQDSCFMSIGNHKLHSLDFLLLLHSVILLLSLSPFSYFALFF